MAERQPFYKYIIASLFLATCLEFSRFFEFKLTPNNSMYVTTCMAENPYYVQYNSYWNEIFATGLVPLILLCFMNLKIFQKIKVRAYFLTLIILDEIIWNNQYFFFHLYPKLSSYSWQKLSNANGKQNIGCSSCIASKILIDLRSSPSEITFFLFQNFPI